MITIDSRGCGCGKTTDPNGGIYARIRTHIKCGERVLVVVPSIALQEQYSRDLAEWEIIPRIINNTTGIGALQQLWATFANPINPLVIITHATFLLLNRKCGYKGNWHLIVDEAPRSVISIHTVQLPLTKFGPAIDATQIWQPSSNASKYWNATDDDGNPLIDPGWRQLITSQMRHSGILGDSEVWRRLTNTNYELWTTQTNWSTLINNKSSLIISALHGDLFTGWASIHLAAAAFEHTLLRWWMDWRGIRWSVIKPFKPHKVNITYHTPAPTTIRRWSKSLAINQPEIITQWEVALHQVAPTPILRQTNVGSSANLAPNHTLLPHNSSGLNNPHWMSIEHISLESAINPHPQLLNWMIQELPLSCNKWERNKAIRHLWAGYDLYQSIMRSAIRVGKPIHIWMLDHNLAADLVDYWDSRSSVDEVVVKLQVSTKSPGRPVKYQSEDERREARNQKAKEGMRRLRAKDVSINGLKCLRD